MTRRQGARLRDAAGLYRKTSGLEKIAGYADGIGPWAMMLVEQRDGRIFPTTLLPRAQQSEARRPDILEPP